MKLFQDGVEIARFPYLWWNGGLLMLHGVQLLDHPNAVYRPLLKVWRGAGAVYIETPKYLVVLRSKRPIIQILEAVQETFYEAEM